MTHTIPLLFPPTNGIYRTILYCWIPLFTAVIVHHLFFPNMFCWFSNFTVEDLFPWIVRFPFLVVPTALLVLYLGAFFKIKILKRVCVDINKLIFSFVVLYCLYQWMPLPSQISTDVIWCNFQICSFWSLLHFFIILVFKMP